jgi:hypothetical protein
MDSKAFPLASVFKRIKRGHYHATNKTLDKGNIPLISCTTYDNGVEGFYDVPDDKTYKNCITIASNGQPMTTFYHPYTFTANDDVLVCEPKDGLKLKTIYYIVACLNKQKWRFSYGRKCYYNKINKILINAPVKENNEIDEMFIDKKIIVDYKKYTPTKNEIRTVELSHPRFEEILITKLFTLSRGSFHAIDKLDPGHCPTASRIAFNNGIVGFFQPPDKAKLFGPGLITVSTVTGDAFIQYNKFISTDNVVICTPKHALKLTTLIFIQYMLNRQKWRYSYGRQCYKTKFSKTKILLPVIGDEMLDEDFMESVVTNKVYWRYLLSSSNIDVPITGKSDLLKISKEPEQSLLTTYLNVLN